MSDATWIISTICPSWACFLHASLPLWFSGVIMPPSTLIFDAPLHCHAAAPPIFSNTSVSSFSMSTECAAVELSEVMCSGEAAATAFAINCTIVGRNRFPCLFSKKCFAAIERIG
ncbi:unnamed protein product [Pseudo-nitzschia multistriata]|uniref:Secreted protein n=1 Tax=Pseudo-nitzschia multistriata TaxID=183589 RepID=A0A448ZFY0_9STRA|nr:unnamed protein product [Pseudo-nitzschia multistriata]